MTSKPIISYLGLQKLAFTLRRIFSFIRECEKLGFEKQIKYPQIPSALSENLAIHELERGLIPELEGYLFGHGDDRVDVVGIVPMTDKKTLIEVKAAGDKEFVEIRPKDLDADYIVWFCFGGYFKEQTSDSIDVYVIPKPRENGIRDGRIVRKKAFKQTQSIRHSITSLVPIEV